MPSVGGVPGAGGAGIVVVDEHERPLVRVEAVDPPVPPATGPDAPPFTVLVSADEIRVYAGQPEPAAEFSTAAVLGSYHRGFRAWRLTPRYLMTLTEAWLSDLAYGWRDEPPPGEELLTNIGLVPLLRQGVMHVVPDERGGLRP